MHGDARTHSVIYLASLVLIKSLFYHINNTMVGRYDAVVVGAGGKLLGVLSAL